MDCVMNDIKKLGVENWWIVATDRDRGSTRAEALEMMMIMMMAK